jgi:transposase
VEALLDLLRTASPWRLLPHDFPNRSTVQRYFYAWQTAGLWETINFLLLQQARERAGREARPSAGVIDSQSAKTTESGGPRGFDAGKKINRRKRHIITDTAGYLVAARVHAADIQDRDGAPDLLASIRYRFPWLRVMSFADRGYAGDKLATALARHGKWRIEIVKRSDRSTGFHGLPRRWVVERTFAWLNRNRRLAKDFEATEGSSKAWVYRASLQLLVRRLARPATDRIAAKA